MPWFITAIISNESLEREPQYKTCRSRTFGFYNTYGEAYEAITNNWGDIHECLADLCVLEYIEPGIHPIVHNEIWFKWDDKGYWRLTPEKPVESISTTNWALG